MAGRRRMGFRQPDMQWVKPGLCAGL
jgi:hypothetical protein